jgi:hypothetical protein
VGINGVYNPASGFALDVSGDLQVQDGTFDIFYPTILRGLKVSPTRFNYNPKTPTDPDSFKIELDGANCRIYKGDSFDVSACVIQNNGGSGIALASGTTKLYLNNSGTNPGVGINNTNPQYTLDVSGNANVTGNLTNLMSLGFSLSQSSLSPNFIIHAFQFTKTSISIAGGNGAAYNSIYYNSTDGTFGTQKHIFTSAPYIFLNIDSTTGVNEARLTTSANTIITSPNTFRLGVHNSDTTTLTAFTVQVLVIGY